MEAYPKLEGVFLACDDENDPVIGKFPLLF
jgi:hypothetical protein